MEPTSSRKQLLAAGAAVLVMMGALAFFGGWFSGSPDEGFHVTDANWDRGVARKWAGFYVDGASKEHEVGRLVTFKNGETRSIVRTHKNGKYLNVFVAGNPLDPSVHGMPPEYKLSDAAGGKASDPFYLTDANWNRGVARRWAGFFVPKGAPGYAVGATVRLKNGETRKVTRAQQSGPYLNVYLEGKPLDPLTHGAPPDFVVQ
jgi:hypothetical protein